ncbi:hypothetical protein [Aequorivita capsosiphonis]|uniref:hypothetical protein n=1 Tax=Aequorivita capsosiphonis TaxID=487317 RepID=UPI000414D732|nr:hypothetical protein [Aequorivita capsosiphonis]
MNTKNLTAFFLAGLFLMNLMAFQSGALLQILSGKKISVVHPFCENSKSTANSDATFSLDLSSVHSLEIPVICTSVFDFKTTALSFVLAKDNFKDYVFSDTLHLSLFTEPLYLPPRV